jgi:serine/threonine protein kinase
MLPEDICSQFDLPYSKVTLYPLGKGLINDTYLIDPVDKDCENRFVLQRINKNVFKEPGKLMQNLIRINQHLKSKNAGYQKLFKSVQGQLFYIDDMGDYWRITNYLENTVTLYEVSNPEIAYEAARSYGHFLHDLHDLEVSEIKETIPGFHNYKNRIVQLQESIKLNNRNRITKCHKEIEAIHQRLHYINTFYDLNLPLRVIHSDTKIDNILFDAETMKSRLVIDLDISMPGSILYDYGDMVRSFTNTLKEDDPNLKDIDVKMDIFEYISKGFLESTHSFIFEKERNNLILGAKVIILIQAIRNLADYLNGDIYYKINYEDHNLHRAQNQLTLVAAIERHEKQLHHLIGKYI